jgi:hypothetical protein
MIQVDLWAADRRTAIDERLSHLVRAGDNLREQSGSIRNQRRICAPHQALS